MADVNESVIAKLRKGNEVFEILVDCDKALLFKEGKATLDEALTTEDIFKDVKKGLHASENELENLFKTRDSKKISEIIIKKGEIQLTADHKNKLREEKKRQIITLIHQNAINPRNGLPHPVDRIEIAMGEAKVNIDEFKKAEDQFQNIAKQINTILPIKIEKRDLEIVIAAEFSSQCYGVVKKLTTIKSEQWQNNGDLSLTVEIPAGIQEELENQLNKITHGETTINILEKK